MIKPTAEAEKRRIIAERIAVEYSRLPEICSLAIAGSTARGNADRFSDLEIWMTYSSMPDAGSRLEILRNLDESGNPVLAGSIDEAVMQAESLVIEGVQVGLMPGTNDQLLEVPDRAAAQVGEPSEIGIADFHDCIVLYDPNQMYHIVKARLNDYPISAGTRVINRKLQEIDQVCQRDIPRAVESNSPLTCRTAAIEALLRIVFVLNRDYFPRLKDAEWLLPEMPHLPMNFTRDIASLSTASECVGQALLIQKVTGSLVKMARQVWPEHLDPEIMHKFRTQENCCGS